ncbi:hypothetical protein [uncultured Microbulbifer sp.]|uniref:hypothetical protein n=1 Tax=uncultured Microbulbifer sp. TaxID=348147 RepID=UPI0026069DF1|nr:hypothetical protein [uncultured Microbulbifer sp.]
MEAQIKRLLERAYPELKSGLHLPLLARIVAISDPTEQPELAEEFRPRYGVDVQLLNSEGKADKQIPIFRSVPLPLHFAGNERGAFGFPQPGTLVELAFAYGRPDQPFIRTVLCRGLGVPALDREDLVWQQSDTVRQKVDAQATWHRETHGEIRERALQKTTEAAALHTDCDNEHRQVRQHSMEAVAGIKLIEALGALRLLSGGSANLSALDNLNLTTASDINVTVGRDLKERVGNIAERIAKLKQVIKVEAGGTLWLGNTADNVLQLLSDLMGVVKTLADDLATHTHLGVTPGSGKTQAPESADTYTSASADTGAIKNKLDAMKG